MSKNSFSALMVMLLLFSPGVSALDLTHAVVVAPTELSRLEKKAVTLLVEEVEKSGRRFAGKFGLIAPAKGLPWWHWGRQCPSRASRD